MRLTKGMLHIAASILILIGLVLLVAGLQESSLLWQIGLGAVAAAMALSLATRWAPKTETRGPKGRATQKDGWREP